MSNVTVDCIDGKVLLKTESYTTELSREDVLGLINRLYLCMYKSLPPLREPVVGYDNDVEWV